MNNEPQVTDNCADAVMDIVNSAPRIKEVAKEIEAENAKMTVMMDGGPEETEDKDYSVKVGIDGDLKFETVTSVRFNPNTMILTEVDWLTGEAKVLEYDRILLKAFPENCKN